MKSDFELAEYYRKHNDKTKQYKGTVKIGSATGRRIYISGAITGTADYMERFAEAETDLIKAGYEVVNPAKVNAQMPKSTSYEDYMKMSLCMLRTCDGIYMLDGWENSKGAKQEILEALKLDINIYLQNQHCRLAHEELDDFVGWCYDCGVDFSCMSTQKKTKKQFCDDTIKRYTKERITGGLSYGKK